jgi:hypothetical protein
MRTIHFVRLTVSLHQEKSFELFFFAVAGIDVNCFQDRKIDSLLGELEQLWPNQQRLLFFRYLVGMTVVLR